MSERTKRIAWLIGWVVAIVVTGFIVYRLITTPFAPPPPRAIMSAKSYADEKNRCWASLRLLATTTICADAQQNS